MRFKLFSKELFGGTKKLMLFCIVSMLVYIIVAFQLLLSTSAKSEFGPDVIFYGQPSETWVSFEKYADLSNDTVKKVSDKMDGTASVYGLVERNIITVQRENSLENITYTMYGATQDFIKLQLEMYLQEGRLPADGVNEVLVGGYFAKAFELQIGDTVSVKTVNLTNLGQIDISFDLSGENSSDKYTVVGIIGNTGGYFEYSAIVPRETQSDVGINSVWIYFTGETASEQYVSEFVNDKTSFFANSGISVTAEPFQNKNTGILSTVLSSGYIFFIVIVLSYLMISYIFKGLSRKLGVLKAIGVSGSYIFKCYFIGVMLIQVISYLLSMLLLEITCRYLNNMISDAYGYVVSIYSINIEMVVFLGLMFLTMVGSFGICLYLKINYTKPKAAMNMKG